MKAQMNVGVLVIKLRQTANLLEELFGTGVTPQNTETPIIARKILEDIEGGKRNGKTSSRTRKGVKPGYRYKKGTHWTQKPENQARLAKMVKKAHKTRQAMKGQDKVTNG